MIELIENDCLSKDEEILESPVIDNCEQEGALDSEFSITLPEVLDCFLCKWIRNSQKKVGKLKLGDISCVPLIPDIGNNFIYRIFIPISGTCVQGAPDCFS